MARRRFEQLPEERQDAIIRVAAAEFARGGFHGTSYNQLLERLQLGKSSAYYYFDDKRDLFLTALQHTYARFFAAIRGGEPPEDVNSFWRFIEQSSERGYVFMLEDQTAANLMLCIQREQALLGELGSKASLSSNAPAAPPSLRESCATGSRIVVIGSRSRSSGGGTPSTSGAGASPIDAVCSERPSVAATIDGELP